MWSDQEDSTGSTHYFTVCSRAWRYGWSWGLGGYSRMARQFAVCCEKQTRNIQSAGVQKTEWHQQSESQNHLGSAV
uniref:Uncharacterized protein n=1 Tax=Mastacembelus armatus TaxID=205130 RepID=A0A7N8YKP8_9TELE